MVIKTGKTKYYRIHWASGRVDDEETLDGCMETIEQVHPKAVYCLNGESCQWADARELQDVGRILVWATEKESENDSGAHAIASITTVN